MKNYKILKSFNKNMKRFENFTEFINSIQRKIVISSK